MEEYFSEFIMEAPTIEGRRRITTIRDAQDFTMKKVLNLFEFSPIEVDNFAQEARNYPDYETMNMDLLASVYYIWSQLKTRTYPSAILDVSQDGREKEAKDKGKKGKEKKGKKAEGKVKGVYAAPNLEVQKEVFKTGTLTDEHRADLYRYMKYVIQLEKQREKERQ